MPESSTPVTPTEAPKPGKFYKGMKRHPDSGWKPFSRGGLQKLREFMTTIELSTSYVDDNGNEVQIKIKDPAEWLLFVGLRGRDPLEGNINRRLGDKSPFAKMYGESEKDCERDGMVHVKGYVPFEARARCLVSVMPFVRPKFSAVEVTGDVSTNHEQNAATAEALARDPEVRRLFEKIAEKAADMDQSAAEGGAE